MSLDLSLAEACAGTYVLGVVPQWTNHMRTVHAFLSMIDGVHVVAFEGTTDLQEWLVDFLALPEPFYTPEYGPTHFGITETMLSVSDSIEAYFAGLGFPPYYVTGHSKGAGEAILFHAEMKRRGHPPIATRAFEPPLVGSRRLRDYLSDQDVKWTSTVNAHGRDIVTQVPFGDLWTHVNDPILLTVPDDYDIPTKHRIPAVVAALAVV